MKNIPLIIFVIAFLFSCVRHSSRTDIPFRESKKSISQARFNPNDGGNVISMRPDNGVYFIPITINDIAMEFIFDTGASDITISKVEAIFLYKQGKLTEDDILGTEQYQIADGSIKEGTVIILRKVQIGEKVLNNVKATVVHNNEAPLLLGQTALSRFGKISIDYEKNQIEFR